MEKFPYEYFQNLEKLEQAIQAIKFDLTDEKLLEYKNMTPERKRSRKIRASNSSNQVRFNRRKIVGI
ncbi:hypothetical protein [Enterococcus faecium]|uniref:hypothetical protein n=1 Tax=Enterococcus faecium TaxID=1352 RepID=UPI0018AD2537|nr:hypothetical protein [Enterococcus faecium]